MGWFEEEYQRILPSFPWAQQEIKMMVPVPVLVESLIEVVMKEVL
jgi:hypothetical protein